MKTALLGGTFNPVHDGHMDMAQYLLAHGYERVVFAPSNNPGYKNCENKFDERLQMLQAAIEGRKDIEICALERERPDNNYSYITLPLYRERLGDFDFVIGGDSLVDLDTWRNPEQIIRSFRLVVFVRSGREREVEGAAEYWRSRGAEIVVEDYVPKDVSSTLIRLEARLGLVRNVPKSVARYIAKNNLYIDKSIRIDKSLSVDMADKLLDQVGERTYRHCLRVAYCALKLNCDLNLGLDSDKVLLAGLLHDCAKKDKDISHATIPQDSIGTPVFHQFAGCVKANNDYGITDNDVLQAIRYHTTAKPDMSDLDKLIFCADMLEEDRDFDGVQKLREIIARDLHAGFVACIEHQYSYLTERGGDIYPLTKQAVEYYRNTN
ncbi:MAG: nicotinate (nicotinamide) nucleotide adenylyltransferase [Christensenellales bacterium]